MERQYTSLALLLLILPTLSLVGYTTTSNEVVAQGAEEQASTLDAIEAINVDGDVSLADAQNRMYWNPHSTGLTSTSSWSVTFRNETEVFLKTTPGEAGHVATGSWWTAGFKSNARVPLCTLEPQRLWATFRVNVESICYEPVDEWLRIALACAVNRGDGSVVYTEMDFWDSPSTLKHPSGNVKSGGDTVYSGGDVVEYKIDQVHTGEWTSYSLDLTHFIDRAWSLKPSDMLESVYVVVETMGTASEVRLKVDDLWITWASWGKTCR